MIMTDRHPGPRHPGFGRPGPGHPGPRTSRSPDIQVPGHPGPRTSRSPDIQVFRTSRSSGRPGLPYVQVSGRPGLRTSRSSGCPGLLDVQVFRTSMAMSLKSVNLQSCSRESVIDTNMHHFYSVLTCYEFLTFHLLNLVLDV